MGDLVVAPPGEMRRTDLDPMELLADLSRSVKDPAAAVAIASQMADLAVKMETLRQEKYRFECERQDREAKVAYAEAISVFKENPPAILKTKLIEFETKNSDKPTRYWSVELDKACDLLVPALLKVGITHRWKSAPLPNGNVSVTCYLRHRLGYEEEGATLAGPPDTSGGKNPIQGVGSATSYLEKYTLLQTCGLVAKNMDNEGLPPQDSEPERIVSQGKMDGWREFLDSIAPEDFLSAVDKVDKEVKEIGDRRANLEIIEYALENAPNQSVRKEVFKVAYTEWKKSSYPQAEKRVTEAYEKGKTKK